MVGAVGSVTGAVGSVTAGVTLANGAITNASLAGNMEIVFETGFATNYNATRNAWATNVQDTVGSGNLPADVIQISGDATAANNAELAFDGTGFGFTNCTIPTVTTCVNNTDMRGTDGANTTTPPTAAAIVNEWETQSQADPTGFHVNVMEINSDASAAAYLVRNAKKAVPVTFSAGGTVTTAVLNQVDGSAASSSNDVYNDRVLLFETGTLQYQISRISDYDGATKTATITQVTVGPGGSDTAVML